MLIPSIDLQGGRIVQLVQGEECRIATDDIDGWIDRLSGFQAIQLIDLDAAKGTGRNDAIVARVCGRLPCRIGGGLRTMDRVLRALDTGARKVIVGSGLFRESGVDVAFAERLTQAVGSAHLIAAVDARGGRVAIHGWKTVLPITPADAIAALEPYVDEFLFTNIDLEGLMHGVNREAVRELRSATRQRLTIAGGVTTHEEVEWLASIGCDAVAGMAIYTGVLDISAPNR